jgi:hypothetical protein
VRAVPEQTENYLRNRLLPFWIERAPEPVWGGFQTSHGAGAGLVAPRK